MQKLEILNLKLTKDSKNSSQGAQGGLNHQLVKRLQITIKYKLTRMLNPFSTSIIQINLAAMTNLTFPHAG